MIIAIDGHSSCGKSSFAKKIAEELNFLYIDSGAMYRAVTLYSVENGLIQEDVVDTHDLIASLSLIKIEFRKETGMQFHQVYLNDKNVEKKIRSMEISELVSEVSKIREVRERMVILQRQFSMDNSVVMDGRDIGTVVFPEAELKIFMTARLEIRAHRRFLELKEKGMDTDLDEVKNNLAERDRIDQGREVSPLRKAEDAIVLDNSFMTMDDQMIWFRNLMEERNK